VNPAFAVPPSLKGQVNFWIQIFTKYGKYQMLFHHRGDPAIIYSVLDLTEAAQGYSGSKFERFKELEIERETKRIQSVLRELASGAPATQPFEKRIELLFSRFGAGDKRQRYLQAAEIDEIRTQSGVKERFYDGLKRSGQYLGAIEAIFSERGLPSELGRLPFVESSFDYDAYSSVGAAGIWQFMRGTAKSYMRVGAAIDERRDPIVSTRAAAQYLGRAYKVLGAWPLAVTSYNHGVAGVYKASVSTGSKDLAKIIREYNGRTWGFASKNFYTEFLAALEVERNYKRYFPNLILDRPVYFDEVRVSGRVLYGDLVSASGLDADEFEHLNPALRRKFFGMKTPVPAGTLIKVPYGKGARLVKSHPGTSVVWQYSPSGAIGSSVAADLVVKPQHQTSRKMVIKRRAPKAVKSKAPLKRATSTKKSAKR